MRSFAEDGSHAPPGASHKTPFCSAGGTRLLPSSPLRRPPTRRKLWPQPERCRDATAFRAALSGFVHARRYPFCYMPRLRRFNAFAGRPRQARAGGRAARRHSVEGLYESRK